MTDEKNPFINPIAEGSNTASGSKQKGKEVNDMTEWGQKLYDLVKEERQVLTVYGDEWSGWKIHRNNIDNEKSISYFKNKKREEEHKDLCKTILELKEEKLAKLENSLINWIKEGIEQTEVEIKTQGVNKAGVAAFGTAAGGSMAAPFAIIGAEIGTALFPGVGTVVGGTIGGLIGGLSMGIGSAALWIHDDEKTIQKQTKEQLEKIVLDLTKRQQEEKDNLNKFLVLVRKKMIDQEEIINELKERENKLLEKIDKLEKELKAHDGQNIEQNRKLWGKENEIAELRRKLIDSHKREILRIIRPSEIETEEADELILTYEQLYWAKEKCNSREIENKKKKVREIEKEIIKKIDNDVLEEKIFRTCKEVAELNFWLDQQQEITQQLLTQTQVPPKD